MINENTLQVSVGMPVYNGERYIAQSIESILSQTFQAFELIISDNASTDATEQICREYAAKDPRVRYYRSDRNHGASWNHNRVVELARGEYFRWQCHDDYCGPTLLEKCLPVVHNDPSVVLCYPQFVRVNGQGRRLGIKSSEGSRWHGTSRAISLLDLPSRQLRRDIRSHAHSCNEEDRVAWSLLELG